MTQNEINTFRRTVSALIDSRRLRDAMGELKSMARRRMAWEVTDAVEQTERNYAYMLKYVADGIADPGRAQVYDGIVAALYHELDTLVQFMEKTESATLYYSTVRTIEHRAASLPDMLGRYAGMLDDTSLFGMLTDGASSEATSNVRQQMERLQSEIFHYVWTRFPLSEPDTERLLEVMSDNHFPAQVKTHLLSALTLGLMHRFDGRRLQILMETYLNAEDTGVSVIALIGMLLGLWRHPQRPLGSRLEAILAAVKEKNTWAADLRMAFIEMIRARDTERINRKMRDEVIPRMMNLRPDIMKKINDGSINPEDMASIRENPEWEELLDKNGITDRLKELTEIQMEGGDVFMSAFAHLKQFPFFSDIANWFLPFSTANTHVAATAQTLDVLADIVECAIMLCDSDKYSFMFALAQVPEQQRSLMTSQLQAQRDMIYEHQAQMSAGSASTAPEVRKRAMNAYMQNIYRFFKLFPRRSEFFDPFLSGINLISVPVLSGDFTDTEMLPIVAEFYFKLGYYKDALDVFARLEAFVPSDAQRYQKMGYSNEKLQQINQAIEYYQRAELLDSRSAWTRRRLAACYRAAGNKDMALKYYRMLASDAPEDMKLAILLGYVLMENGNYKEALNQFYKVEFEDEKSSRAWRPLAWILFLTGDFDASGRYYSKILLDNPTANDYLNMGHVALAAGNVRESINNYRLSIAANDNNSEAFREALQEDSGYLREAGVDPDMIPLVADAVLYNVEAN